MQTIVVLAYEPTQGLDSKIPKIDFINQLKELTSKRTDLLSARKNNELLSYASDSYAGSDYNYDYDSYVGSDYNYDYGSNTGSDYNYDYDSYVNNNYDQNGSGDNNYDDDSDIPDFTSNDNETIEDLNNKFPGDFNDEQFDDLFPPQVPDFGSEEDKNIVCGTGEGEFCHGFEEAITDEYGCASRVYQGDTKESGNCCCFNSYKSECENGLQIGEKKCENNSVVECKDEVLDGPTLYVYPCKEDEYCFDDKYSLESGEGVYCKQHSKCGNGVVDYGEECDDGNLNEFDGCTNNCEKPTCGDGYEQVYEKNGVEFEEECDPPQYPFCNNDCTLGRAPVYCTSPEIDSLIEPYKNLTSKKLDIVVQALKNCYEFYLIKAAPILNMYPRQDQNTLTELEQALVASDDGEFNQRIEEAIEVGDELSFRIYALKDKTDRIVNKHSKYLKTDKDTVVQKQNELKKIKRFVDDLSKVYYHVKDLNYDNYYYHISVLREETDELSKVLEEVAKKMNEEESSHGVITTRLSSSDIKELNEKKESILSDIKTIRESILKDIEYAIQVRENVEFPANHSHPPTKEDAKKNVEDYLRSLLEDLQAIDEKLLSLDFDTNCSVKSVFKKWNVREPELSVLAKKAEEKYGEDKIRQLDSRLELARTVPREICEEEELNFCINYVNSITFARLLGGDIPSNEWEIQYRNLISGIVIKDGEVRVSYPEQQVKEQIEKRQARLKETNKALVEKIYFNNKWFEGLLNDVSTGSSAFDEFLGIVNNVYIGPTYTIMDYMLVFDCGEFHDLPSTEFNENIDDTVELTISGEEKEKALREAIAKYEREIFQLHLALVAYRNAGVRCESPEENDKEIFNTWVNVFGNEIENLSPRFDGLLNKAINRLNISSYPKKSDMPSGEFYLNLRNNRYKEALQVALNEFNPRKNIYGGTVDSTLTLFLANDPAVSYLSEISLTYFDESVKLRQLLAAGTVGTKSEKFVSYARGKARLLEEAQAKFRSQKGVESVSSIREIISLVKSDKYAKRDYPELYVTLMGLEEAINYIESNEHVDKVIEMINREDFKADTWSNWTKQELPRLLGAIALGVVGGIACAASFTGVGAVACMAIAGTLLGMFGYRAVAEAQYRILGLGIGSDVSQYFEGQHVLDSNGFPTEMKLGEHLLGPMAIEFITGALISFVAIGLGRVFVQSMGKVVSKLPPKAINSSAFLTHIKKATAVSNIGSKGTPAQRAITKHLAEGYLREFRQELGQELVLEPGVEHSLHAVLQSLDLKLYGLERFLPALVSSIADGLSLQSGGKSNYLFYNINQKDALIQSLQSQGLEVKFSINDEFNVILKDETDTVEVARYTFVPKINPNLDIDEITETDQYQTLLEITGGNFEIVPSDVLPHGINARTTITQSEDSRSVFIEISSTVFDDLVNGDQSQKQKAIKQINEEIAHSNQSVIDPREPCHFSLEHYIALRTLKELVARAAAEGKSGDRDAKINIGEDLKILKSLIDENKYAEAKDYAAKVLEIRFGAQTAAIYISQFEVDYNSNIYSPDSLVEVNFNADDSDINIVQKRDALLQYVKDGLDLIKQMKLSEAWSHFNDSEAARRFGLTISPGNVANTDYGINFDNLFLDWLYSKDGKNITIGHLSGGIFTPLWIKTAIELESIYIVAEEWCHAIQDLNEAITGNESISEKGKTLEGLHFEVDVAWFFHEQGIHIKNTAWIRRYERFQSLFDDEVSLETFIPVALYSVVDGTKFLLQPDRNLDQSFVVKYENGAIKLYQNNNYVKDLKSGEVVVIEFKDGNYHLVENINEENLGNTIVFQVKEEGQVGHEVFGFKHAFSVALKVFTNKRFLHTHGVYYLSSEETQNNDSDTAEIIDLSGDEEDFLLDPEEDEKENLITDDDDDGYDFIESEVNDHLDDKGNIIIEDEVTGNEKDVKRPEGLSTKQEVLDYFGVDPEEVSGISLGGTSGARSIDLSGERFSRIKRTEQAAKNELAITALIDKYFSSVFVTVETIAYPKGDGSYIVLRKMIPNLEPNFDIDKLTPNQKSNLAILANVFGLNDLNFGNILHSPTGEVVLLDFEQLLYGKSYLSLAELDLLKENIKTFLSWGHFPFVDRNGENSFDTYNAEYIRWQALVNSPTFIQNFSEILRESGFTQEQINTYISVIKQNIEDYREIMELYFEQVRIRNGESFIKPKQNNILCFREECKKVA